MATGASASRTAPRQTAHGRERIRGRGDWWRLLWRWLLAWIALRRRASGIALGWVLLLGRVPRLALRGVSWLRGISLEASGRALGWISMRRAVSLGRGSPGESLLGRAA